MKKTTSAFIAMLLAVSLALLSSCDNTDTPSQPDEKASLPAEDSSFDEIIPEESSETSAEPETSEDISEPETSEDISEPEESLYIPPLGTPTTLVPVLEFGFGKGDYKLGYKEDDYGFPHGPFGMWINGNDILINDGVNRRLLVYRDGELIDEVDTNNYDAHDCAITDEYYYFIGSQGTAAYRIDRKTKEFEEIEFESHDPQKDNDYLWSYTLITIEDNIYIYGYHYEKGIVCDLINGTTSSPAKLPESKYNISTTGNNFVLVDGNGKRSKLDVLPKWGDIEIYTYPLGDLGAYPRYIRQEITIYGSQYTRYRIFYKISKSGKIIGRYVKLLWSPTFQPIWESTLGGDNFQYKLTDNGDLLVVDGSDEHVGIYKVEFGMDEIPYEISDKPANSSAEEQP